MKDEKKRTLYLKVRVSPEEMAAIKKKFENIIAKIMIQSSDSSQEQRLENFRKM